MGTQDEADKGGAAAPTGQQNKARWWTMISARAKRDLPFLLKGAARQAWAWLRLQAVEIGKELRQAANPPVRVRRLPGGALAIVCKPAFGGLTTVLSAQQASQVHVSGNEVRSYPLSNETESALIGAFPDEATARHGLELISNALVGGRGAGRWVLGAAAAVIALVFVSALFRSPATVGGAKPDGESEQAPSAAPQADVLRDAFGASAGPLGAATATNEGPATAGEALADKIYAQAMAASQQTAYEAGPPQSPIENPNAGDFGLGVSSKEGCDPALKFKVAAQP